MFGNNYDRFRDDAEERMCMAEDLPRSHVVQGVVYDRQVLGMTYSEIAEHRDITRGAVAGILNREGVAARKGSRSASLEPYIDRVQYMSRKIKSTKGR